MKADRLLQKQNKNRSFNKNNRSRRGRRLHMWCAMVCLGFNGSVPLPFVPSEIPLRDSPRSD